MRFLRTSLLGAALFILLASQVGSTLAKEPDEVAAAPCTGTGYSSGCDVDQDGDIDILDVVHIAERWGNSGTFTSDDGHNHLGQVWTGSGGSGLGIGGSHTGSAPLQLRNSAADGDGLIVTSAADDGAYLFDVNDKGVYLFAAGTGNGVEVNEVGLPVSSFPPDVENNAFAINGVEGDGLYVGRADKDGVYLLKMLRNGLTIDQANQDGVHVYRTGSPTTSTISNLDNGFEVEGAGGHGWYLGRSDRYGAHIRSVADDGVEVVRSEGDGIFIAPQDGVGLEVESAGSWYGYFNGEISAPSCAGNCGLMYFAINGSDSGIEPGTPVSALKSVSTAMTDQEELFEVLPATDGAPLMGVVVGRGEPVTEEVQLPEGKALTTRLVPRDGAAKAGDYVQVVVRGLAQVMVKAGAEGLARGTTLTSDAHSGSLRAVRQTVVNGLQVSEQAHTLGVLLQDVPAGGGLVWVMVNPR